MRGPVGDQRSQRVDRAVELCEHEGGVNKGIVRTQLERRCVAAPTPILGSPASSVLNWIGDYVGVGAEEVASVRDASAPVSPLDEVPRPAVTEVEAPAVFAAQILHS